MYKGGSFSAICLVLICAVEPKTQKNFDPYTKCIRVPLPAPSACY